jgi:hypothetical protein
VPERLLADPSRLSKLERDVRWLRALGVALLLGLGVTVASVLLLFGWLVLDSRHDALAARKATAANTQRINDSNTALVAAFALLEDTNAVVRSEAGLVARPPAAFPPRLTPPTTTPTGPTTTDTPTPVSP